MKGEHEDQNSPPPYVDPGYGGPGPAPAPSGPGYPGGGYPPHPGGYPAPGGYPNHGYASPQQMPMQMVNNNANTNTNTDSVNVVVSQPSQPSHVFVAAAPKPNNCLIFSIVTCICCSPLFGLIGIVLSCLSTTKYEDGDSESAKTYGHAAFGVDIAGIVVSIIIFVILYTTGAFNPVYY